LEISCDCPENIRLGFDREVEHLGLEISDLLGGGAKLIS